jgi:hypothetical protein
MKNPTKAEFKKAFASLTDSEGWIQHDWLTIYNRMIKLLNNKTTETNLKDEKPTNFAVSKTKPAYNDKGKTNFNIRGVPGVYIVYEGKKIIYIGKSGTNVYRTMYRHFETWTDKTQQRVRFKELKNIRVRVTYTRNETLADKLESALILKYKHKNPLLNVNTFDDFVSDNKDKQIIEEWEEQPPINTDFKGDLPF